MTRTTVLAALAAVALAGIGASLASAGPTGVRTARLHYQNVDAIVLDNTQGHVHVTVADAKGVTVERATQTLLTHATSGAFVRGHVLHLTSRCHGTVCEVDYRIDAPVGVRLRITEKNATVSVDGAPGDVTVTNIAEGDVTMNLTKAPRHLRASTHKGSIDLAVPRGMYAITATAGDGNKNVTGVTTSQNASHAIEATTDSGDITISGS
jgi:Putative adhesin